jgi:hypothetical protein
MTFHVFHDPYKPRPDDMSNHIKPHHMHKYHTIYISHKTIPCHNIPHHTTPYHATPCQKALYHTNDILNHTISHKTIRYDYYDTIPYHKNSMHDNFFSPST